MPLARGDMPGTSEIIEELRRVGQVSQSETIDLELLPKNPQRADAPVTDTYRVSRGGRPWCHLTVGSGLRDRWLRATAFAAACPQVTCTPLFYLEVGDAVLLGVSWFDGVSLEDRLRDGTLAIADARLIIERLHAALTATREPSTADAAAREFEVFAGQVLDAGVFSAIDHVLLREVVLPFLRDHALRGTMETRLTNADFVARNVLVADDGGFRLIDCEFAQRTHFFAADAWRWREFSNLPAQLKDIGTILAGASLEPWIEAYSILQHLLLVGESQGVAVAIAESRVRLPRLFAVISSADERLRASLLWPILTTAAPPLAAGPANGFVTAQLFWSPSAAFNELASRRISYPSGEETHLSFVVPQVLGEMHLRFDPAEATGLIHISSLQVSRVDGGRRDPVVSITSSWETVRVARGLLRLQADHDLSLLSLDIDPSLLLPLVTVTKGPSDLLVEIRIRHDADLGELPGLFPQ